MQAMHLGVSVGPLLISFQGLFFSINPRMLARYALVASMELIVAPGLSSKTVVAAISSAAQSRTFDTLLGIASPGCFE